MQRNIFQGARSWRLLAVIGIIMLADQASKWFMLDIVSIAHRPPMEITSFFKLVMVWNHGISFGMLSMPDTVMPWVLIGVALIISIALWVMSHREATPYESYCYAVIIGGALGNVIDRLRFGAVADFFYLHVGSFGWPAFNIADASIFLGVGCLLIRLFFSRN